MSEPAAVSRGAPAPSPDAVHQLTAALYAAADAVDDSVPPRAGELPDDGALKPVTDAVRPVLSALGGVAAGPARSDDRVKETTDRSGQ
jgi:hypothetical protein